MRTGRQGVRLRGRAPVHADADSTSSSSDSDDEAGTTTTRRSAKSSFMVKVLSPVLGYSSDFELLQF
eukprot:3744257-Prorocentrum_lima.AAC.1